MLPTHPSIVNIPPMFKATCRYAPTADAARATHSVSNTRHAANQIHPNKKNPKKKTLAGGGRRGHETYELEVGLDGGGDLAEVLQRVVAPAARRRSVRRRGRVEGVH
ncbi:Os02g0125350, partial [Oryza sativa Japonica Group]